MGDIGNAASGNAQNCTASFSSDHDDSHASDTSIAYNADPKAIPIIDILQSLNRQLPAHIYMQYLNPLKDHGILYAGSALDFNKASYISEIGMVSSAVGHFLCKVTKVVEGVGRKHARKEKAKQRARKQAHQMTEVGSK